MTMLKQIFSLQTTFSSAAGLLTLLIAFPFSPTALGQTGDPATNLAYAINGYRNTGSQWNRNIGQESDQLTLLATPQNLRGNIILTLDQTLMDAAKATAEKFANGTYSYSRQNPHHQPDPNGLNGPMVRAIKDNWSPSINSIYPASVLPPFTGIRENLFQGPANLDFSQVLEGWKNSPGHNFALLKAQAHRMGVGMAQNGTHSYWVFLVESEAHMDETQEAMPLFGWNTLFRIKPGGNPGMPNPSDAFEFVPGAIANIRSTR